MFVHRDVGDAKVFFFTSLMLYVVYIAISDLHQQAELDRKNVLLKKILGRSLILTELFTTLRTASHIDGVRSKVNDVNKVMAICNSSCYDK